MVIAVEEENTIISKNGKYRSSVMSSDYLKCNNCGRNNHDTSRCFLKGKKDVRVNQFSTRHERQGPAWLYVLTVRKRGI
jgi:hypothetical protein